MRYLIGIVRLWWLIRLRISREDNLDFFESIIRSVGEKLIEEMKSQLVEKDAIATSYLYNSFTVMVEGDIGRVENKAPYSSVLEVGCVPHTPPYDAILNWVYIKKKETGEDAERAAWRIVKKIEREGYEGRFYARDSLRWLVEHGGRL
jgi:hypothetical protein